ncbi:DNA cytosine methyltransferase [Streptomyces kroppenstedtii]|uniref:DNA cytosine methyltransferase n=1 Tax=Streptomyces kroppenstedtii TaxID=3051181 RepID=UPI0028D76887|nr:DNA cytosine methyltransferase [Streptomyces sp. DSM 40484]
MSNPEPQTRDSEDRSFDYDVLDLFAGPGGLDVAAHFLGLTSVGIELDGNACETRYRAGLPTIHADVTIMRKERYDEVPHTRVLAGGPPCQSFSIAGKGAGREALDTVTELIDELIEDPEGQLVDKKLEDLDARTGLVLEPLRYLLKAITSGRGPYQYIVLEQVPAVYAVWDAYARVLTSGAIKRPRLDSSGQVQSEDVKYEVAYDVLRTEEYGVPQTRKRAVLIARLIDGEQHPDKPLELPDPTHARFVTLRKKSVGDDATLFPVESKEPEEEQKESWRSMHAALHAAKGELDASHDSIPRNSKFYVVSNYGSGGDPKKRGIRHWDQPSFTVTGKISRNRPMDANGKPLPRFTIHEAGVLQSFPGDFPWSGKDQAQQVGNAVPPLFGMHVLGAALGMPPSFPDELNLSWGGPVDTLRSADLRLEGCPPERACPTGHPYDQPAEDSSTTSRPRTGASAKSPSK